MILHRLLCTVLLTALPLTAQAQCRIKVAGSNCVAVPQTRAPEPGPVKIGEVIERGEYSVMMNVRYYGLPPVSDGWVYMNIEDEIYRVDWRSLEVLERVTHQASRNW